MSSTSLEVVAADGIRLVGQCWRPRDDPRATVVLVHGFGASSYDARVVALVEALVGRGLAVVVLDSRGHGASEGEATLGDRERFDVAAAVEAAGTGPVVLVGASMGAIGALRYATDEPAERVRVVGMVIVSCPARWTLPRNARGGLSALLTYTPPGRWVARQFLGIRIARPGPRPAPPIELVAQVGAPIAVVHGRADPFIPVGDAEALYAAAPEPRRLELVDGMGHAFERESIEPVTTAVDWALEHR